MPEWERYIEKAEETLSSAKILFEHRKYNSAISEAYYSQHNAARALLSLKDLHPRKHKGVVSLFGLEFVNKGYIEETYGKTLSRDMRLREKVDYEKGWLNSS